MIGNVLGRPPQVRLEHRTHMTGKLAPQLSEHFQGRIRGTDIFHINTHKITQFLRFGNQFVNQCKATLGVKQQPHLGRLDRQIAIELFPVDGPQYLQGLIFEFNRLIKLANELAKNINGCHHSLAGSDLC
jgi:hypothetical protein